MRAFLRAWLRQPALREYSVDDPEYTIAHREILSKKPLLRGLYMSFYRECARLDRRFFGATPGLRVEIGSGAGIIKDVFPDVITTDIKRLPFVDVIASGDRLPFRPGSLRSIYAINVFHHLPDVRAFFVELQRMLAPGGGAIFIEPYYGMLARWLFRRLHDSETFDAHTEHWEYRENIGALSRANQALSYVVFVRDRQRFERSFPGLEIVLMRPHTHIRYIASGGLNFRSMAPAAFEPALKGVEALLSPLHPWLAIQHTIVLRHRGPAAPG